MRATDFIKEGNDFITSVINEYNLDPDDHQLLTDLLQIGKDCKHFISQVKDPLGLYRGITDVNIDYDEPFIISPNKRIRMKPGSRAPMGMSTDAKAIVNEYFIATFGESFRDSALTTGDIAMASAYGNVTDVLPIGDFTFLWSPKVDDLNVALGKQFGHNDDYSVKQLVSLIRRAGYQTTDMDAAKASGNEIMLRAEQGYHGITFLDLDAEYPRDAIRKILYAGSKM